MIASGTMGMMMYGGSIILHILPLAIMPILFLFYG
jgi:hypothetical protein